MADASSSSTESARTGAAHVLTGTAARLVLGAAGTITIAALIGPAEKGALATLVAVSLIASTVASLGMDGAIRYYLATKRWSLPQSNTVAIVFTIASGAVAFLAFEGVRAVAPRALLTGLSSLELATATAVVLLGMLGGQALLALKEFSLYAKLSVFSALANPILFLILRSAGVPSLASAIWAWTGAQAAMSGPAQIALIRKGGWRLGNPSDARGALSYGLRSVGWDLLNLINLRLDVLMLRSLASAAATGAYAMAAQLTEVVWVVPTSVGAAVFPEIAAGGHERGVWTARVCRLTSVLSTMVALVIGVAATILIVVLLPAYRNGIPALWLLLPGTALAAASKILSHDLNARGRPQASLAAAAIAVVVTVVGDLSLVPALGSTGAALVSSAAYIIYTLVLVMFFTSVTQSRASAIVPRFGDVGEAVRLTRRTAKEFLRRTQEGEQP